MRAVPYFLSALLLCAMLGSANAAPATIEGSWSGSGIAKFRNRTDRVVCRVSFARIEGKSFLVSALCSTGGRRYEESGRVTSVGGNRYTGWVFNEQFNERGNVLLSQRGSRLSVTVQSSRGTANLTLSRG
jgi:hypothetical protein